MSKIAVVSSHLDDGIFSCGDMLSHEKNTFVITVFAGIPKDENIITDYDLKTGFDSSHNAMIERQGEDIQACCHLGAAFIHLPFYDFQYGLENNVSDIISELSILSEYDIIYAPFGVKHPDHIMTNDIVMTVWLSFDVRPDLYLYEELPYRIIEPKESIDRIDEIKKKYGCDLEYKNSYINPTSDKVFAIHKYKSQLNIGDISAYTVLVPERHWRVTSLIK